MKSIILVLCFAVVLCNASDESVSGDYEDDSESESGSNSKEYNNVGILKYELFNAIMSGNLSEVQSLIERGAQLSPTIATIGPDAGKPISTPLHTAIIGVNSAQMNHKNNTDAYIEILKLLLINTTNLEVHDFMDETPLYSAVSSVNPEAVKVLLEHGANPNAYSTVYKSTALRAAFSHQGEETINLLIEHGADLNSNDESGYTPLHLAIAKGYKKTIELLIEKGANVNAVETRWMTPLHFLVTLDQGRNRVQWTTDDTLKFAEQMINHGADVYAKALIEGEDKTALDLATSDKIRKFLGSKMGLWEWIKTRW